MYISNNEQQESNNYNRKQVSWFLNIKKFLNVESPNNL